MSDIRYEMWQEKICSKNITSVPALKTLPPTSVVFGEHMKRSHFQSLIWLSSLAEDPPSVDPLGFGWKLDSTSKLVPVMLPVGVTPVPEELLKMVKCGCSTLQPCSSRRCSCFSAKLSCSIFCCCKGSDTCCNPASNTANYESDDNDDPGEGI